MNRLKDKIALVTGGGSGIRLATAKLFISEGAACRPRRVELFVDGGVAQI